jgi:GT2 family glycosyltransferase
MTRLELTYILIPVHNRQSVTLNCLSNLKQQGELDHYHVIVIDDGSTDGTSDAIQRHYPAVTVLAGDGQLWWAGAIRKGMEFAVAQGADYLIWLNDDCLPQPGAIAQLIKTCRENPHTITAGQSLDPETFAPTYGGLSNQNHRLRYVHATVDEVVECSGLAGNFVCLPKAIVTAIGYPNHQRFPHYYADVVYTHLAKRKGWKLLLVGAATAFCKDDHTTESWLLTERSLVDVWRDRFKLKSNYYWKAHLGYYIEFLGLYGLWLYIYIFLIKFFTIFLVVSAVPLRHRTQLKRLVSGA